MADDAEVARLRALVQDTYQWIGRFLGGRIEPGETAVILQRLKAECPLKEKKPEPEWPGPHHFDACGNRHQKEE